MSDKIAALEAELALAKAEAEFVAKKENGDVSDEDRQALRVLRQEYREAARQPAENGATPAAIGTKAKAK